MGQNLSVVQAGRLCYTNKNNDLGINVARRRRRDLSSRQITHYSDLCIEAVADGWSYQELVNRILEEAIERYQLNC